MKKKSLQPKSAHTARLRATATPATTPKNSSTNRALKFRELTWCEHDVIGTFLVEHKDKFQEHIISFGYTEGEAKLMRHHIAEKIWNRILNP